eukprot:356882-Chlamydomonas_euryale.AAC.2
MLASPRQRPPDGLVSPRIAPILVILFPTHHVSIIPAQVRGVLAWEVQRPGGTWAQRCIATSSRDATIRCDICVEFVSNRVWCHTKKEVLREKGDAIATAAEQRECVWEQGPFRSLRGYC